MQSRTGGAAGVAAALAALRADLERRLRQLNEEISHYPGPIARCDQHLAALIETRSALFARLARVDELAAPAAAIDALLRADADETADAPSGARQGS
jgi:hypothetical protein